jgi:hypothetical protein
MFEAGRSQGRRQDPNQFVKLAVIVRQQSFVGAICEAGRIGVGARRNITQVAARLAEDAAHGAAAVIASIENRACQRHEPPQQIEGFCRVGLGHRLDYGAALQIEIAGERANALPIDKRP